MTAIELFKKYHDTIERLDMLAARIRDAEEHGSVRGAQTLGAQGSNGGMPADLTALASERLERLHERYAEQDAQALRLEDVVEAVLASVPSTVWGRQIRRRYMDGWNVARIAREAGCSPRVVYRNLQEAMAWIDGSDLLDGQAV